MKPYRILMIGENLPFPADRRIRHEACTLHSFGYEVFVITPKGHNDDHLGCEIYRGIHLYRYRQFWQGTGPVTYMLEYGWALICTFVLMLRIWLLSGFDCIHVANPPDLLFLVALPFRILGKKLIFDQHDVSPETYEAKFGRRDLFYRILLVLERLSYASSDLVIATNQSFVNIAKERGKVPPENLFVVRNGPDLKYFSRVSARPELRRGFRYMVTYVGIMGSQDGVDRLVGAACELQRVRGQKDVLFVIIGKGDCWQALRRLSEDYGVADMIFFPGRISDEELRAYLSTADLCAAPDPPSAMNRISTMNKIMEYMVCGSPIVSFDLTETRYSAQDAAVYVEGDDPAQFAIAIQDLLEAPERRTRMGAAGFRRATTELHWGRSEECLLQAYTFLGAPVPKTSLHPPLNQSKAAVVSQFDIPEAAEKEEAI